VRSLIVAVTLVCAYFGAWEATRRYGPSSVCRAIENEYGLDGYREADGTMVFDAYVEANEFFVNVTTGDAPFPFLVSLKAYKIGPPNPDDGYHFSNPCRRYYLWLFGFSQPTPLTLPDDAEPRAMISDQSS
jgi:hypothetical protein